MTKKGQIAQKIYDKIYKSNKCKMHVTYTIVSNMERNL